MSAERREKPLVRSRLPVFGFMNQADTYEWISRLAVVPKSGYRWFIHESRQFVGHQLNTPPRSHSAPLRLRGGHPSPPWRSLQAARSLQRSPWQTCINREVGLYRGPKKPRRTDGKTGYAASPRSIATPRKSHDPKIQIQTQTQNSQTPKARSLLI